MGCSCALQLLLGFYLTGFKSAGNVSFFRLADTREMKQIVHYIRKFYKFSEATRYDYRHVSSTIISQYYKFSVSF